MRGVELASNRVLTHFSRTRTFGHTDAFRTRSFKVDATEEKDLATRYGVSGFPTLKYFPAGDGEVETYGGARSLEAFVDFINEKVNKVRVVVCGLFLVGFVLVLLTQTRTLVARFSILSAFRNQTLFLPKD